jgi:hypothetical protein
VQGIRREEVAKAKGLGIIGLMLLVAGTVHYWPRAGRDDVAPRPEPAVVVSASQPAAVVVPAQPDRAVPRRAELQFRPPELQFRSLRQIRPEPAPAPVFQPDAPPIAALAGLPGTVSSLPEMSRSTSFVPTLVPALVPAPSDFVLETRPVAHPQEPARALTAAAKATGKGLAVAFQKTGAAFRKVF